jgi:hypothetical protein
MKPENEWLFYTTAAWNVDQAAHIAKNLIDNPPDDNIYASKLVWSSAYKYSIVSYCSPFMGFRTSERKKNEEGLSPDIVPHEFRNIHAQIKDYRDQILAHTDIRHLETVSFDEGYRITFTSAHLSPPSIQDAVRLFSAVSEILIQKQEALHRK